MGTPNTIDFILTGNVGSLSHEAWAELIWRIVKLHRASFEHFLGFRPLCDFHEKAHSGAQRLMHNMTLHVDSDVSDAYCSELAVVRASSYDGGVFRGRRIVRSEIASLLISRETDFLLQTLKIAASYPYGRKDDNPLEEELLCCDVRKLDYNGLIELFKTFDTGFVVGEKVLTRIVALAWDTHDRRVKMATKDLETHSKLQGVLDLVKAK